MSWLFGKSSNNPPVPSTTPLQQQRLKQIKSLSSQNQNVTEVQRDMAYKITFQANGNTFNLDIRLPPQFPHEKPFVTISPSVYHPWVDSTTMEIKGSAELSKFYMHSDLGKVIHQIVKELKKNPPKLRDIEPPSNVSTGFLPPYPPPVSSMAGPMNVGGNFIPTLAMESVSVKVPQEPQSDRPPAYGASHVAVGNDSSSDKEVNGILQEISSFPKSELEKICKDPDVMIDRIAKMESVETIQAERRKLIERSEDIAKSNLSLEPEIEDLKGALKETFEEYNELYYAFQEKSRKQDELSQIYDIGNILTNIRIGVMQGEEDSEKVADDFITGAVNVESFLTNFIEKRKEYHMRRAKEERIKGLVPSY